MIIETKYNIGDEVWIIFQGEIRNLTIRKIVVDAFIDNEITIDYKLSNGRYCYEHQLFPTKEELLNSL